MRSRVALLFCFFSLVLTPFVGCNRATPTPSGGVAPKTMEPQKPSEPVVIKGRRIDITAGPKGYDPPRVTVAAGEDVTLVFTRTVKSHCLSEIMIPSLKFKEPLPMNQPVAVYFTPTRSGEVPYSCGMDMIHGTIAVE